MRRRGNDPLWGSRGMLALLSLVAVAAAVHAGSPHEAIALSLYGVPVLFGATLYGRRGGVHALVIVMGVIVGIATLVRPAPEGEALVRWLHIVAWAGFAILVAWVAGSLRDRHRRRGRDLQDATLAFRGALARLLLMSSGQRDEQLARVAELAVAIARNLGDDQRTRDEIHAAALLSSFASSDTMLAAVSRSAGMMPARGGRRRDASLPPRDDGFLERVSAILASLRERWDGTGRLGLTGEATPQGARIIAVASAFDLAANGNGALSVAGGLRGAVMRLESGRGSEFDPSVVDMMLRIHAADSEPRVDPEIRRAS